MNENSDLLPNLLHEEFEMQMRGYSRRQVDDFVARRNNDIRELEQRLARTLDDSEHLRRELSSVRHQALAGRPAHEEISERISQILKLADDEANAQKTKADDEIARQRADAQQESERVRADAREQAERMLTNAQEQAERTISASRTEAEKTRTAARNEADRLTGETRKKADATLAQANAQAKALLDEATVRATAIHDGAERRLSLLSSRHAETVRRLSDILDGVQGLVSAEAGRMSLEEEVNQAASRTASPAPAPAPAGDASTATVAAVPESDLDLALLAPPAAETVSAGTPAPPHDDGTRQPAGGRRTAPTAPEPSFDAFEGPVPVGGGLTPLNSGRAQPGRPGPAATTPQPGRPNRAGAGQQDGPSARALGDSVTERESKRDVTRRTSLIDSDEPDEGLRLMP